MATPLVSVIVTTYNQEDTISRTLDSILAQERDFDIEIIIGEDCSTDNTLKICREYAKSYPGMIRLSANNPNKGIVDNYFDCLLECRGRYIADCAGDDWWTDPCKLQKQVAVMESSPGISLVHTDWNYYDTSTGNITPSDPKSRLAPFRQPLMDGKELLLHILRRDVPVIIHSCTAMYRRDMIMEAYREDTSMFRNKEFTCEDIQLEAALCSKGDIAFLPDNTLNYSIGHDSISSDRDYDKTFCFYLGTIRLNRYLEHKYNIPRQELNEYYCKNLHFVFSQAFYALNPHNRRTFIDFVSSSNLPLGKKTKILILLSSFKPLWRISVWCKRNILGIKGH